MPCAITPHREQPQRSFAQRCDMVRLAIAGHPHFELDEREGHRQTTSYTLLTLQSLKKELGESVSLFFIMGTDAFSHFESWHRYQEILKLCHLVLISRPGEQHYPDSLQHYLDAHQSGDRESMMQENHGLIYCLEGPLMDISSTRIRSYFDFDMPNAGENIRALSQQLPEAVKQYIHQHGLYQERHY